MRVPFSLAIGLALAIGCASAPGRSGAEAPPGIFFPVMKPAGARPAALIEGTLVRRSECLWLDRTFEGRLESFLVLWPAGSRLRESGGKLEIVNADDRVVGREGELIRGGGGETRDLEFVRDLTGQSPPAECQQGEAFWRLYDVLTISSAGPP